MTKEKDKEFEADWYQLWEKQGKEFFNTANANIKHIFDDLDQQHSEENTQHFNDWLKNLKHQWEFLPLNDQQKIYQNYWKMWSKMSMDAADMLALQWSNRMREQKPVKDMQELYQLWLECCQEIYTRVLQSKNYQEAYGEYLQAAMKFWKSVMPNKR